jgi:hypothetical protein
VVFVHPQENFVAVLSWARTGSARLGSVQPGSDQANVRALLQNLSVPETKCSFMTRWSTMESSSFMLIITLPLPGHFIIADISYFFAQNIMMIFAR